MEPHGKDQPIQFHFIEKTIQRSNQLSVFRSVYRQKRLVKSAHWEQDKTADFKRDKTADFQNRTKQPIFKTVQNRRLVR